MSSCDRFWAPRPSRQGDPRYDALLAGWAEFEAEQFGLEVPGWTARAPVLSEAWYVSPYGKAAAEAESPEPLRRRGVMMERVDLMRLHRRPVGGA